jgi:hypothetical protein
MCRYILPIPICDHPPPHIWAMPGDESCPHLFAQLRRIYDPEEWACPGRAGAVVPFELPRLCGPCRENICVVRVRGYCPRCRHGHYHHHHRRYHCYDAAGGWE